MNNFARMIRSLHSALVCNDEIANAFYGIACVHSLRGNKLLSLQFLEKSLQRGFKDISQLENDSDMKTVRDESGWKRLMERYS